MLNRIEVHVSTQVGPTNRSSFGSYTRSTRCHGQPDRQNVASRVLVPIMDCATGTRPIPDGKRHHFLNHSALTAHLAAGEETVNADYILPVRLGLFLDLPNGGANGSIGERPREAVVFQHSAQVQVLNANRIESAHKIERQFVLNIGAAIRNLFVQIGYALLPEKAPFAAFLFPGKLPLHPRHAPGIVAAIFRIRNALAIRKRCESIDAEVKADRLSGFGKLFDGDIHYQRDEVSAGWLANQPQTRRLRNLGPRPLDFERPNFCNGQRAAFSIEPEPGLGVFDRLPAVLAPKSWIFGTFLKKVDVCSLQITQGLLLDDAGTLRQPRSRLVVPPLRHVGGRLRVIYAPAVFERLAALRQRAVEHVARAAKLTRQVLLLGLSRVASERPTLYHALQFTSAICKSQQHSFPPRPERRGLSEIP